MGKVMEYIISSGREKNINMNTIIECISEVFFQNILHESLLPSREVLRRGPDHTPVYSLLVWLHTQGNGHTPMCILTPWAYTFISPVYTHSTGVHVCAPMGMPTPKAYIYAWMHPWICPYPGHYIIVRILRAQITHCHRAATVTWGSQTSTKKIRPNLYAESPTYVGVEIVRD